MKAKIIVSEITHDDLVDLFSTALYGNYSWSVDYDSKFYREKCVADECDCCEDVLAKCLLNGGTIEIGDRNSEDASDVYGNNKRVYWDDKHEIMIYPITLSDVKNGLEKAYENGQAERVNWLINEPDQMDITDADVLLQYIVYGDVVYG